MRDWAAGVVGNFWRIGDGVESQRDGGGGIVVVWHTASVLTRGRTDTNSPGAAPQSVVRIVACTCGGRVERRLPRDAPCLSPSEGPEHAKMEWNAAAVTRARLATCKSELTSDVRRARTAVDTQGESVRLSSPLSLAAARRQWEECGRGEQEVQLFAPPGVCLSAE
jgi:hypothetical protein